MNVIQTWYTYTQGFEKFFVKLWKKSIAMATDSTQSNWRVVFNAKFEHFSLDFRRSGELKTKVTFF